MVCTLLLFFYSGPSYGSAETKPVYISADLIATTTESVDASLVVEPIGAPAGPVASPFRLSLQVPGRIEIPPLAPGDWVVRLTCEGCWAEEKRISQPADEEIQIRVFGTAELAMEMPTREKQDQPEIAEVGFFPVPKYTRPSGQEVPEGGVNCAVVESEARCRIPAGEVDLRIEVAGAAPIYFWNLNLEEGQSYNLGKLDLVPGGSIAGFIMDENERPLKEAIVALEVSAAESRNYDPILEDRLHRVKRNSKTNERGFFQVTGVPPGTYTARGTKEGFSPGRSEEWITIRGDLEVLLASPLILGPPTSLRILIDPPLDPFGAPWQILLLNPKTPRRFSATLSKDGSWLLSGVEPGFYLLMVRASDSSRWLGQEIKLETGEQIRHFEIPVIQVAGTVKRKDAGVQGRLSLLLPKQGSQVDFVLDEDGRFKGFLPAEGLWDVQVEIAEP